MNDKFNGPWSIGGPEQGWRENTIILDSEGDSVCDFVHASSPNEDSNARLIAAAPLMYEALRKFAVDYVDAPGDARLENNPLGDAYDEVLAAIAAATETPMK